MKQIDFHDVRAKLAARRLELNDRLARVERDLERRNDPLLTDSKDRAIQLENDEVLQALGTSARDELAAIDEASRRLDANTYGSCKLCGRRIPKARLEVTPYATTCTSCQTTWIANKLLFRVAPATG